MRNFNDRCIVFSYYRVLALIFGIAGVMCALASGAFFLSGAVEVGAALAVLTVPCVGSAAVLRVRSYFGALSEEWAAAFEMGREVGREEGGDQVRLRPVR